MDFAQEARRSRRFWRQVRQDKRRSNKERSLSIAWKVEDQSALFEQVRGTQLGYVDDFGVFALIQKKGPEIGQIWIDDDDVKLAGRGRWHDDFSGSVLFAASGLVIGDGKPKRMALSLARYAWWFHHGYDCASPRHFPHTGGCHLIDTSDPRFLPPENLQTRNDYLRDLDKQHLAIEAKEWHQALSNRNLQKRLRITTTLDRCRRTEYPDPVRDLVQQDIDPYMFYCLDAALDAIWTRDMHTRADYYDKDTEQRLILLPYSDIYLPAANVLWHMATGTFIGNNVIYRDGNCNNISINNLTNYTYEPRTESKRALANARRRVREIAARQGLG